MQKTKSTSKAYQRLLLGIMIVLLLLCCLSVTSYALVVGSVEVRENYFQTGRVELNINDGKPVIERNEFLFEPGMTVNKQFFVQNDSTWEVWYKVYFSDIRGDLAPVLEITLKDGDTLLYQGKAADFTRSNLAAVDQKLAVGERRVFDIIFHYPELSGNESQGKNLSFRLCAEAVQTKNNPDKQFD